MVAIPKESWSGKIKEIAFGATDDEGGTRDKKLLLGGETTLPFLAFRGQGFAAGDRNGGDRSRWRRLPHIIIDEIGDVIKIPLRGRVRALMSMVQTSSV